MHPGLFRLGPLEIRFYGLMYVIAIIVGIVLMRREVERKKMGLGKDDVMSYAFWTVIGGIAGARIYYVLFKWKEFYAQNPFEVFKVWHGGLAIHGGIIGGVLAAYIYAKVKKVRFFDLTDATAPMLALGQVFGRFGNFMNGDAHGVPTDLPWGIVFPKGSIAGDEFPGQPLHPVMLYELVMNLVLFLLLWKLRKRDHKSGFIFALYLLGYGVIRFFVTFFRADDLYVGGIRGPHIISTLFIVGSLACILIFKLWKAQPSKRTSKHKSQAPKKSAARS